MASPEVDAAMHRQLGELTAGMRSLQESMKRVEEQSRRSEDKSDQSRAAVHRRMDDMVHRVSGIEQTVAVVKEDVSEMKPTVEALDETVSTMEKDVKGMKPVTDDVKRWKMMGMGALGMIGIGGIALGVSFGDAVKRVASVLIGKI
ncbi:DUF1515 family protein [Agrobacterium rosae]|uniref:DUF1515 family protein n=1 Tax=Agrobacterium rosae TaxID=1972867 RepID=UPI002033C614|nr:DUF1515 family protein [Agrobacterium rosae]MCM2434117.1 DUF1515 domain-containing protein [Agrobacterium rosae]